MIMNMNEVKVLSTVEYGSTFQKTNDEKSDVDQMSLVLQPLASTVFGDLRKGSHHDGNNDRFYSVERFVQLTLRGNFDAILLLSAQLIQARDTDVNQNVFKIFYDHEDAFGQLILARQVDYINSLKGNLIKVMKQNDNQGTNGKSWVKEVVFANRLAHALAMVKGDVDLPTYDNYIDVSQNQCLLYQLDSPVKYKRLSEKELKNKEAFRFYCNHARLRIQKMLDEDVVNLKNHEFEYKDKWVDDTLKYLINHY